MLSSRNAGPVRAPSSFSVSPPLSHPCLCSLPWETHLAKLRVHLAHDIGANQRLVRAHELDEYHLRRWVGLGRAQ